MLPEISGLDLNRGDAAHDLDRGFCCSLVKLSHHTDSPDGAHRFLGLAA